MRTRFSTLYCVHLLLLAATTPIATAQAPGRSLPQVHPPTTAAIAETEAIETGSLGSGSVVVKPFTNLSRRVADDWLGSGIAESLMADLAARGVTVILGNHVSAAASEDQRAPHDDAAALAFGREMGADWVVTGGYQRLGDQLRITARLVEMTTGVALRGGTAEGAFGEVFVLQDRIARQLVGAEDRALTAANAPMSRSDDLSSGGAPVSPTRITGGIIVPEPTTPGGGRPMPSRADRMDAGVGERGRGAGFAMPAGVLAGRPTVGAVRAEASPRIDGRLDDALWQRAARITEFVQQSPLDGAPATEDTEVYVAYDDTHLYIGMYAHYSDPSMIRANRVDRDQGTFGDDYISVYFDTFLDQKRAYVFSLNGYGVQNDSILEPRSGGGGGSRGRSRGRGFSGGGRSTFTGVRWGDSSWNALFESGGTLVDDGWTAEMAIPFKSLRYPAVENRSHRWGFQIARRIRGKDETDVWSPMSRDVSGLLPQMGLLDGLSGLSTSRNLELLPTMTAVQVGRLDRTNGGFPTEAQPEGGVNVKYGLTSNLTLDATFNPDFSQIESDRPQIEVNQRFPLFFPELRPFFLEGQEIFNMPGPVNFVHTRTIVDPRYGGKMTGKVGDTTVGVLVANDQAPGNVDDAFDPAFGESANVLIGRVRYDLYSESHIGAIVTDREFLDDYSRLGGIDGQFRLTDTTSLGFRAITTRNREQEFLEDSDGNLERTGNVIDTTGNMFDVGLSSQGRNLNYFVAGYTIAPEFDTDVGFVRRRDVRSVISNVGYRFWPESWLINWGPTFAYGRNWDFTDTLVDETAQAGVNFSFAKSIRFGLSANQDMERFGGINFNKRRYSTNLSVSTLQSVSVGGFFGYGDEVNYSETPFLGRGGSGGVFMTVRPFSRLQSQVNISTSNLVDPFDDSQVFDVKIYRALTTYQFTDRLLLRNILEHNTFSGTLGANVLVSYRVNSGTVFFLGYDDRYQQGDLLLDTSGNPAYVGNPDFLTTDLLRTNRAFFTKISYLFRY